MDAYLSNLTGAASAAAQLARISRLAPFNFNLTANQGLVLWFILFFLIADVCPPYFTRWACRCRQED